MAKVKIIPGESKSRRSAPFFWKDPNFSTSGIRMLMFSISYKCYHKTRLDDSLPAMKN